MLPVKIRMVGRGGGTVDAADLKSAARKGVWVRIPPPAPTEFVRKMAVFDVTRRPPKSCSEGRLQPKCNRGLPEYQFRHLRRCLLLHGRHGVGIGV
jgi:hypothetical protein